MSTGDLRTVYHNIRSLIKSQDAEYQAKLGAGLRKISHKVNQPLFASLVGRVTKPALDKIYEELERSRRRDFPLECHCTIQKVMGLPCGHVLAEAVTKGYPISLAMVHQHWQHRDVDHEGDGEENLVLDPLTVRRGVGASISTSTRREQSSWEATLQEHASEATPLSNQANQSPANRGRKRRLSQQGSEYITFPLLS